MKQIKFDSMDAYVDAQRRSDEKKSRRKGYLAKELDMVSAYIRVFVAGPRSRVEWPIVNNIDGICHGVRTGAEVAVFKEHFPTGNIIGTDLFPRENADVIQWDFHKTKPEWEGAFDFLYSNSLDHSHSPKECVETWLSQLKPTGVGFVQWTRMNRKTGGGDCFAASLYEYILLFREVGRLHDIIYVDDGRKWVVVFVVGRK